MGRKTLDPEVARAMGRLKKGKRLPATLEREAAMDYFRARVVKNVDLLLNSQMTRARGMTFLYKIEKEEITGPKGGKTFRAKKPELVTDEAEIKKYLDGLVEEGEHDNKNDPRATYYFLTTKEPDNGAIDSMLDRTFGRAPQSVELDIKRELKVVYDPVFEEAISDNKNIIDVTPRQAENNS